MRYAHVRAHVYASAYVHAQLPACVCTRLYGYVHVHVYVHACVPTLTSHTKTKNCTKTKRTYMQKAITVTRALDCTWIFIAERSKKPMHSCTKTESHFPQALTRRASVPILTTIHHNKPSSWKPRRSTNAHSDQDASTNIVDQSAPCDGSRAFVCNCCCCWPLGSPGLVSKSERL